jgi:hypothetical protein
MFVYRSFCLQVEICRVHVSVRGNGAPHYVLAGRKDLRWSTDVQYQISEVTVMNKTFTQVAHQIFTKQPTQRLKRLVLCWVQVAEAFLHRPAARMHLYSVRKTSQDMKFNCAARVS